MFYAFKSFADFDGCTDKQRLWCFDAFCPTAQNRTWCVSDVSKDETELLAKEWAAEHYGYDESDHDTWTFHFFDPNYDDFMGNFAQWYNDDENRRIFWRACEIEASIPDFNEACKDERGRIDNERYDKWHRISQKRREQALNLLRAAGLKAHLGQIEDVPMWDIIRDRMGGDNS